MSSDENELKSMYARFWDRYVETWTDTDAHRSGQYRWPGDEWGSAQEWDQNFTRFFVPAGVSTWQRAVEIGQGSGKYTQLVLSRSQARIRCYDVSRQFLKLCGDRLHRMVEQGRLSLNLLAAAGADELWRDLRRCDWARTVDVVYSMDAMVHVDLQYLMVYLITAGLVLKPHGKVILSLADATTDAGFQQLMADTFWAYAAQAS